MNLVFFHRNHNVTRAFLKFKEKNGNALVPIFSKSDVPFMQSSLTLV